MLTDLPIRVFLASTWRKPFGWVMLLLISGLARPAAAQSHPVAPISFLDTQPLKAIENRVLPQVLVEGPHQHRELAEYYVAENLELAFRFEHARQVYDRGAQRPFQMVTLIAGDAGVGKTFLKKKVFSESYDPSQVCRFDIRDLYEDERSRDHVIEKPDLYCRDAVLCSLPAIRDKNWRGLYDYLSQQSASFYVIDSLDEVHPDDYVSLLEQVDRFAFEPHRKFVHVVVLGRGIAFRDYWEKKSGHFSTARLNLYMLEPPNFLTTGDWSVSTWNYHRFAHKLRWKSKPDTEFSLQDFQQWSAQNFARTGRFEDVACTPNNAIDARCESALKRLVIEQRYPQSPLRNLAGNGILREIVDQHVREGIPLDEQAFKKVYFEKWLVRDTKCAQRPSASDPEHLELYLRLLEDLAAKVLREGRVDDYGFFALHEDDVIEYDHEGRRLSFPAHRIINRSGLKHLDPRTPGDSRYRFEPIWMHRMLVESYNRRISSTSTSKAR